LHKIRDSFAPALEDSAHKEKITIVAVGSYGKGEASESSDLDLYILFDSDRDATDANASELNNIEKNPE